MTTLPTSPAPPMTETPATMRARSRPMVVKWMTPCDEAKLYAANPPVAASDMSQNAGVRTAFAKGRECSFLNTLKVLR